jgi:uncharacterized protein
MGRLYLCGLTALVGLVFGAGVSSAMEFQVPQLSGPVVDNGGFMSTSARQSLSFALRAIKAQAKTEIAVLTVSDLGGLTIEQASIKVVDKWQLGSADEDNGVLLMFAKKERRARIEVGQGLEGNLTDAHAKRIIDEHIIPLFRSGNTDEGIFLGVYEVAKRTNPELNLEQIFDGRKMENSRGQGSGGGRGWGIIIPVIFILFLIISGRGGGRRGGFGGFMTGMFLGSMMGGRGRRGGGFSGGFGGGGGGFSGGGASGGW